MTRPKRTSTPRKQLAASAPKPKHVTIEAGQRLHIHVEKGGKALREYIAGADEEGTVRCDVAPEQAAPVTTPSPISGT